MSLGFHSLSELDFKPVGCKPILLLNEKFGLVFLPIRSRSETSCSSALAVVHWHRRFCTELYRLRDAALVCIW